MNGGFRTGYLKPLSGGVGYERDELPTPCYLVSLPDLKKNLGILKGVMDRTGCRILLAQKAFSMYALYPVIGNYLSGTNCQAD